MKKKIILGGGIFLIALGVCTYFLVEKFSPETINKVEDAIKAPFASKVEVPNEYSKVDKNNNGIPDPIDISNNATEQLNSKTKYVDAYYSGGYPPDNLGVCTDVIWRGLKSIGVDLKGLMDEDIAKNKKDYWRIEGKADKNIDFRRVPNQKVFFDKYCHKLTSEIIPEDVNNLKEWQPGDILLFLKPYQHVGIITEERDSDGVPFVIHNITPEITKGKLSWFDDYELIHYRWRY
ncbi:MAG: DUF1287 domain-containing protein [Clostridium sp.]